MPYEDALVEELPEGEPASTRVPLSEHTVARIGSAIARLIATVHEQGKRVSGIRPELVYISSEAEPALTGVCTHGPEFVATAPQPLHGPRSFSVPYRPHEALIAGAPEPASDVFSLCATLYFLGSGRHPFGDPSSIRTTLLRIAQGSHDRWPGQPWLGGVLASGLERDPRARPSAAELATVLASVA